MTINSYGYEAGFVETSADDPVYPYPRMDFEKVLPPAPRSFKGIVLENGYVSVTILPELGGRIYSWIDKATGRQLLYQNPVLKPTVWGYRGWWLATGGIEWSFPVEEHGLNEWRPWSYTISGGSVTVSDVESRTGMEVGATISLDGSHAYITLQPWAKNLSDRSQPYQLWLNGMVTLGGNRVSGETQLIIPSSQVTIHSTQDGGVPGPGGVMSWPVYGGRDLSWYRNWGGYIGFFAPSNGFVGLYDHGSQQGMVRAHEPGWPAGTKLFGPSSLSPAYWTDDNSSYLELWSGATGSFWSTGSLEPGATVGWAERWYPVSHLGGFNYANRLAALRLSELEGAVEAAVAVSGYIEGQLTLFVGGQRAAQWPVQLYPGQAFLGSWPRQPGIEGAAGMRLTGSDGSTIAQTGQLP